MASYLARCLADYINCDKKRDLTLEKNSNIIKCLTVFMKIMLKKPKKSLRLSKYLIE
ncbi:hypothetical protein FHS24_001392 [Psychrobacter luti]|uniref:Uncharacterized protein n=1 Tax=Psychrobacter luti TaxID=198481 RepID=A0A839TBT3_9GAMM|nr:hypothetical protein [Psychrobacter luti]